MSKTAPISFHAAARSPRYHRHFSRHREVRDESWGREPDFLRVAFNGPSRVLVDSMRRQSHPHEQMYFASADAYLAYLHWLFPDKKVKQGSHPTSEGPTIR